MKPLITFLRWTARIISLFALLIFILLFIEDGLPFFLLGDDDPALAFHMWALLAMLIAPPLGFFIADEIALLIYGMQIGMPDGLAFPLSAFSFPFLLFPTSGLFYLICWLWNKKLQSHGANS